MTVFSRVRSCTIREWKIISTEEQRIWEEQKKKIRDSHGMHYASRFSSPTYKMNEYFVRFRANAQDPPLLSSPFFFFFSYVDTRWPRYAEAQRVALVV